MSNSYHHGDLKNQLIEAGIQMLQREGIEKLSLRKLAAVCGVSPAAPYSHFESKEKLLEAMQEHVSRQLLQCLQDAVENCSEPNSPQAVADIGKAYVMFFIEHPDYYTFLFSQPCAKIDLSMNSDSEDFPPFRYYRETACHIYRELGLPEERIKYGIISMWAKVHGIAAIASMKYVIKDFEWADVLDKILKE